MGNISFTSLLLILVFVVTTGCTIVSDEPITTPTFTEVKILTQTPTATATRLPTSTFTPTPIPTITSTPTPALYALVKTAIPDQLAQITVSNAWLVSALAEIQEPSVTDLAWTPDSLVLAVANPVKINLYGIRDFSILRTLYPANEGIIDIEFDPQGTWLVSGNRVDTEGKGYISSLELWRGPDWKPLGVLFDVPGGLSSMIFSPSGKNFYTAFASPIYELNRVSIWNTGSWGIIENLSTGTVLNVAISSDSRYLAATPDRYAIDIMDLVDGSWLSPIYTSFTGAVNSLRFSPTGLLLASGHYDGIIHLWDLISGQLTQKIETDGVVQSMAFSPDGTILATGSSFENSNIYLWNVSTGELLRTLDGHSSGVEFLEFSPDGQILASGSYDGIVRLWGIRP